MDQEDNKEDKKRIRTSRNINSIDLNEIKDYLSCDPDSVEVIQVLSPSIFLTSILSILILIVLQKT